MPLTTEVLKRIADNIEKAEASLAELKDVVSDMKLSGMDATTQEAKVNDLSAKLRSQRMFFELRKAKS